MPPTISLSPTLSSMITGKLLLSATLTATEMKTPVISMLPTQISKCITSSPYELLPYPDDELTSISYWYNINSRGPSIRFGTGHIYNSYYDTVTDGINTRDGAQVLVESNTFVDSSKPLYSTDDGYAVSNDNDFGDASNDAEAGTLTTVPYDYTLLGSAAVKAAVVGTAGVTLSF